MMFLLLEAKLAADFPSPSIQSSNDTKALHLPSWSSPATAPAPD